METSSENEALLMKVIATNLADDAAFSGREPGRQKLLGKKSHLPVTACNGVKVSK